MQYWIFLAIAGLLVTSISCISLKYIDNLHLDYTIILSLTFIIMGISGFLYMLNNTIKLNNFVATCKKPIYIIVPILAFILILNNIVMYEAFKYAPNIGYSHLIINFNVILTLLAAYFLFHQKINLYSLFGIIIAFIGLSIVIINQ